MTTLGTCGPTARPTDNRREPVAIAPTGAVMLGTCGPGVARTVKTEHVQVPVLTPVQETVYVDEGMADLLVLLWGRGIATTWSCEDNMGSAYLVVRPLASATTLVRLMSAIDAPLHEPDHNRTGGVKRTWRPTATVDPSARYADDLVRVTFHWKAAMTADLVRALAEADETNADGEAVAAWQECWQRQIAGQRRVSSIW